MLSMGPTLHVVGDITSFRLPGDILQHLPVLKNLLPDRFAGTMFLGVGLLVALGLDELKRPGSPLQDHRLGPGRPRPRLLVPDHQLPCRHEPALHRLRHRACLPERYARHRRTRPSRCSCLR